VYALFTRLKRYVFPALVTLALWVAAIVALPGVAEAQEKAPNNKANTRVAAEQHVVVVDSGDTLWSISSEGLGPDASPWRVARGVERIYALNREQIGPDPNLIFAGQRLSVPPALSGPPASEPSASAGDQASRQAKRGTVGAPRQASKPAPLPDAAQAAPVPAARQHAAEEPPRSPGEPFVEKTRAAIAAATSAVVGLFPRGDHTWRELLGAALLAVSSVAAVLTVVLTLLLAPGRARRSQRGGWREVHASERANERVYERVYERASFDPSPDPFPGEGLEGGTTNTHAHANGAHTNGAHTNGKVVVGGILAAERKRGRLRRRGRPRSPARHVRKGLAHGPYSPEIQHLLRGRLTAAPRRTGVRGR
jgi:LysM repeat protein